MTITYPLDMYPGRQASDGRSYLVQRAEKLALAYVDKPLQVSALSRAIGVSERTLRKLFNEIHGRPPIPPSAHVAPVPGASSSALGARPTYGYRDRDRFRLRRTWSLLSRVSQGLRRKSFGNAASGARFE